MQIVPRSASSLTDEQLAAWSQAQQTNPTLFSSPHLRPEFVQAVAAVRDDVEVAVFEEDERPVAFLPYQRSAWNTACPAGKWLASFQAVIGPADFAFDPTDLLRSCRLVSYQFGHLLCALPECAPYFWRCCESPYMDLTDGYEGYAAQFHHNRKQLQEAERKHRKMGREVGPIQFEPHVVDSDLLALLIKWKSAQAHETRARDIFQYAWVRQLLSNILEFDDPRFCPVFSVLRAGDRVVAISYALRSGTTLHGWHIAYDRAMAAYSPGTQLLLEIAKSAESLGIKRFDLGKGSDGFKARFSTGATPIAEGSFELRRAALMVRQTWWRTRDWIRSSPLQRSVAVPARIVDRVRGWLEDSTPSHRRAQ